MANTRSVGASSEIDFPAGTVPEVYVEFGGRFAETDEAHVMVTVALLSPDGCDDQFLLRQSESAV
ncbi:hypothetical protein [Haladaptatus sp. NG-WS-4]